MTDFGSPLPGDLLDRFAAIVGPAHALRQSADIAPYVAEHRGLLARNPQMIPDAAIADRWVWEITTWQNAGRLVYCHVNPLR